MQVITTHIQADFDAYASMVAAKRLHPAAVMVFAGSQEKSLREYLSQHPAEALKLRQLDLTAVTELIVVDTRQAQRIGPFAELLGRVPVTVYDHHPATPEDLAAERLYCEECGANVTVMLKRLSAAGLKPTPQEATLMALGLYEDTGGLLYASTTARDVQAYAELLSLGADLGQMARHLTHELSPAQVGLLDQLIQSAVSLNVDGLNVLVATAAADSFVEDFALLAHKLEAMFEIDAVFILGQMNERIYLVARSNLSQLDAAQVAARFGGGGHATAAAGTLRDLSLEQAQAAVIEQVKLVARPKLSARQLMTFPAKSLGPEASLDEASRLLNRYHINAAVVIGPQEEVLGVITRQIVTRAQGHSLGQAHVRDYMLHEVASVEPDAPLWQVRQHLIEANQRLLPVTVNGRLAGVITRTDLLLALQDKAPGFEELKSARRKSFETLLKERLPEALLNDLRLAGELAEERGAHVYLVGGIVRDLLLRIDNLDIDLVVEGDGLGFARELARRLKARIAVHEKYLTAVLSLPDGGHIDVATARLEYYDNPGAFPVVEETTLKLDLYRRDFSINAMALSLSPGRFGQLIDFFGSQRDLKERKLRVLHSLSFVEDPSRVIRGVRFEQRYDFQLDRQTSALIQAAVRAGFFKNLPGRRLAHEFRQLFAEREPLKGLERLNELGVLTAIHPDLNLTPGLRERLIRLRETFAWFRLLFTGEDFSPWRIHVLSLSEGLSPERLNDLAASLGLSESEVAELRLARERCLLALAALARAGNPAAAVASIEKLGVDELLFCMARSTDEHLRGQLSSFITTWRHYQPLASGQDLLALGFKPGRALGQALRQIRDQGLNGQIRDRAQALELAREALAAQATSQNHG